MVVMNFGPEFTKILAQHAIWNLIVIQIKGEFKFNHPLLLL